MNEVPDVGGSVSVVVLFWLWWALLTVLNAISTRNGLEIGPEAAGKAAAATEEGAIRIDPACREKIRRIDPSFDERHFMQGASSAYEIVLAAYAAGNLEALGSLLSGDVLAVFRRDIADRLDRREALELTFIGIKEARIVDAAATAGGLAVSVRFVAEIVCATHAPDGTVVEGDPERVAETRDLWTFERDPASTDRAWLVTATDEAD